MAEHNIVNRRLICQWLLASPMLLLVILALLNFPGDKSELALLAALVLSYCVILWFFSRSWLLLLPGILLLLDLSPFSGRFNFNELDIFILSTLVVAMARQQLSIEVLHKVHWLPVLVFVILLCGIDWITVAQQLLAPSFDNPYYSSSYGFKVAKPGLYGLALALLFRHQLQQDVHLTLKCLFNGALVCCYTLFFIILWEKGLLALLVEGGPRQLIASILDFSGAYRVTALVSDMHTGGESIDGIFACLFPLALAAVFYHRAMLAKLIALGALSGLSYAILLGYTRSTYLAMVIALLYLLWSQFHHQKSLNILSTNLAGSALLILLACYFVFTYVGYSALIVISAIMLTPLLLSSFRLEQKLYTLLMIIINALAVTFMLYLHFNSRWISASISGIATLLLAAFILALASQRFTQALPTQKRHSWFLIGYMAIISAAFIFYVGTSGSQITARFATINDDLNKRLQHWSKVVASTSWPLKNGLLGQPTGSFPKNYVYAYPETLAKAGSFTINKHQDTSALMLGGAQDMIFGQRLHLSPQTRYQLTLMVKTEQATSLRLSYCERNLIMQHRYNRQCVQTRINVDAVPDWQTMTLALNTELVGARSWFSRNPTLFFMQNQGKGSILQIKQVSIKKQPQDEELLSNPDFSQGMDNWFFYSDFEHLPWHIKNILIEIFYHTGAIGLLAFMLILHQCYRQRNDCQALLLNQTIFAMVLAWMALGLFASPLDSARASWMFYMLLFHLALGPGKFHQRSDLIA